MILLITLFVLLLILSIFLFKFYKKDVLEPSSLFSLSFLTLTFMGLLNSQRWSIKLHFNTFLVVFIGVIEFCIVCFYTKKVYEKKHSKPSKAFFKTSKIIDIPKWLEIIYLFFSIGVCIVFLYYIIVAVNGKFDSISNISKIIGDYDYLSKFTDQYDKVKLPFIVSNLRFAIVAIGSWINYIIIYNYIYNKKIKVVEILISVVAIIATLLDGSRTGALYYIISFIAMFLIIRNKKNNYSNNFSLKMLKGIAIVSLAFLITFIPLASILGRKTNNIKIFDYMSIYCGGQLKNLDLALQEGPFPKESKIIGSQTFYILIKTLGEKLNLKDYKPYHLDAPFRYINGYNLGNVYTTFYPYIYDFGYFGAFILVFFMALISQWIYERSKYSRIKGSVNINIVAYAYLANMLIMAYFSNKFYENILSMVFLKYLLIWVFCNLVFKYIIERKGMNKKNEKQKR